MPLEMRRFKSRKAAILAGLLLVRRPNPALAAFVPTVGDPFPAGSYFNLSGEVSTPFGLVRDMTISNFILNSFGGSSPQEGAGPAEFFGQVLDSTISKSRWELWTSPPALLVFRFFGRTAPDQTGTFPVVTAGIPSFAGTFLGHSV